VIAALCAALAAWCAVTTPPSGRARALLGPTRSRPAPAPALVAALLVPVAGSLLLGWPLGTLGGLAAAPVVHRSVARLESAAARQRSARLVAQLPTALDLMAAALEVGRPPMTAFALAAEATAEPLGPELGQVASRLAVAADSRTVWHALSADPALAPVARAFRRAEASGMPVAHVVSGVADELRRERRAARRERSRQVSVRTAAPLGACFLPAFFLVGIAPTIIAVFSTFRW
jgi:Flp pilus assembly protein TadB